MNLDLSKNFLDETETNMDTEEECLSEMINNWLLYHQPSMEILNNALSQMNLPPITFNTASRGIQIDLYTIHTHIVCMYDKGIYLSPTRGYVMFFVCDYAYRFFPHTEFVLLPNE